MKGSHLGVVYVCQSSQNIPSMMSLSSSQLLLQINIILNLQILIKSLPICVPVHCLSTKCLNQAQACQAKLMQPLYHLCQITVHLKLGDSRSATVNCIL
uniref:Uncharacterized protein n=1 Tax=Arundo donax TaxID=35708 RepID=A0A0A9DCB0_ARUDO